VQGYTALVNGSLPHEYEAGIVAITRHLLLCEGTSSDQLLLVLPNQQSRAT
jgi:hypothetical protein